MKHMRITADSSVVVIANTNEAIPLPTQAICEFEPSTSIILPIIIGRDHDIINHYNLWKVLDPTLVQIYKNWYPIEIRQYDDLKLERHPDIGVYDIHYDNNEVLSLALAGEMIDSNEYCDIMIRYDDKVFTSLNFKIVKDTDQLQWLMRAIYNAR